MLVWGELSGDGGGECDDEVAKCVVPFIDGESLPLEPHSAPRLRACCYLDAYAAVECLY